MPNTKTEPIVFPRLAPDAAAALHEITEVKHELVKLRAQNKKIYTTEEVNPLIGRLFEVDSKHVDAAEHGQDPLVWKLIERQVNKAYSLAWLLLEGEMHTDVTLRPTLESLASVWTGLRRLQKLGYTTDDVRKYQESLHEIDAQRVDGKFFSDDGEVATGQAELSSLLHHCYRLAHNMLVETEEIDPALEPTYNKLVFVRGKLDALNRRKSYTESEVRPFQQLLSDIEQTRTNGIFTPECTTPARDTRSPVPPGATTPVPPGQAILSNLLDSCYDKVHSLLVGVETIDPELMPIMKKLEEINATLDHYATTKSYTLEDIHHVQNRLDNIDDGRQGGRVAFGAKPGVEPPRGQAAIFAALDECYDKANDLLTAILKE
eukprot:comp11794_c0_seq1/m.6404 comp11794_c0_seq1/g.6404  ORF comp11794_c0_seq1/g.6404 comp11794_c0_seq1/m.6404 type:complete len:376 (-) comp11794_c0_seq1:249-1376(-)